ncbi:hypothetical protein FKM82_022125 [Ascaphus truei]
MAATMAKRRHDGQMVTTQRPVPPVFSTQQLILNSPQLLFTRGSQSEPQPQLPHGVLSFIWWVLASFLFCFHVNIRGCREERAPLPCLPLPPELRREERPDKMAPPSPKREVKKEYNSFRLVNEHLRGTGCA